MINPRAKLPIGVFDSGVGGISVLAEIIKMLPDEEFVYFADNLNSPYGTKPEDVIRSLAIKAAGILSNIGIKALVVACNTATSVAISEIRGMSAFHVIGMEPAVKPAVWLGLKGKILVMATPLTLKGKKFRDLIHGYEHLSEIIPLPCAGLVEIIEQGYTNGREIEDYLFNLFHSINKEEISTIVLGCTHYVLIKQEIIKAVGRSIKVIDGNYGTAKHLKGVLQNERLLTGTIDVEDSNKPLKAYVRFYMSGNEKEVITKCKRLLQNEGIICEEKISNCV